MAAMMNQNDYMNNPFAYLIWMIFAMRMWNNQDGYEGIQFYRWVSDVMAKKENIDWKKFK